jgi:hypothetical protein
MCRFRLTLNKTSSYPYICSQSSYLNVGTHHLTNNKVFPP